MYSYLSLQTRIQIQQAHQVQMDTDIELSIVFSRVSDIFNNGSHDLIRFSGNNSFFN